MKFRTLLWHQMAWFVLAIGCNLFSIWRMSQGMSPLSSTDPIQGIVIFLVFSPVLWFGLKQWYIGYLIPNVLFLSMIAYGGIALHVQNWILDSTLSQYASTESWLLVVAVNFYGVCVSVLASFAAFRAFRMALADE